MIVFLVIGLLGLGLLVLSVLVEGLFDLFGSDGILSAPAMATFLTSFGFGGAIGSYAGANALASIFIGLGSGVSFGALAGFIIKSVSRMPTDPTPTTADFVGKKATVVTAIPKDGFGEVSITLSGQPVKLSARSKAQEISTGTTVTVTTVLSPTSVLVEISP